ncbi:MAG: hypothetical protein M5T61_05715 [Acidimicrobiia bacterium]|nr:hypothetical protein [Acidimicrobiia bacterium]
MLVAPEGAGKASAPVTLAGGTAAADITVTYCLAPITATETDDYKGVSCLSPKTKTIKTGKSSTAITVKIVDDSDPEADEAVGVVLMGVSGGGATMGNATGVVNIADND